MSDWGMTLTPGSLACAMMAASICVKISQWLTRGVEFGYDSDSSILGICNDVGHILPVIDVL